LRGDVAGLFEIGQRRIDDARARRVPALGLLLEHLDDLVAVARLFGDQRERDQPQVALGQHPAGAQVVAAHAAVTTAEAVTAMVPVAPAAAGGPAVFAMFEMSHAMHLKFLLW